MTNNDLIWQYEPISMLLWAIDQAPFPAYDGKRTADPHPHPAIWDYRLPRYNPPHPSHLRSREEIAFGLEVAMLWHWRAVEDGMLLGRPLADARADILRVFGADYAQYLDAIPFRQTAPRDFLLGTKGFTTYLESERAWYEQQFRWRQHALEWVLNDDTWAHTSADT